MRGERAGARGAATQRRRARLAWGGALRTSPGGPTQGPGGWRPEGQQQQPCTRPGHRSLKPWPRSRAAGKGIQRTHPGSRRAFTGGPVPSYSATTSAHPGSTWAPRVYRQLAGFSNIRAVAHPERFDPAATADN
ncbi:unnamed protein product [Gadus morhua 'NCC']